MLCRRCVLYTTTVDQLFKSKGSLYFQNYQGLVMHWKLYSTMVT